MNLQRMLELADDDSVVGIKVKFKDKSYFEAKNMTELKKKLGEKYKDKLNEQEIETFAVGRMGQGPISGV